MSSSYIDEIYRHEQLDHLEGSVRKALDNIAQLYQKNPAVLTSLLEGLPRHRLSSDNEGDKLIETALSQPKPESEPEDKPEPGRKRPRVNTGHSQRPPRQTGDVIQDNRLHIGIEICDLDDVMEPYAFDHAKGVFRLNNRFPLTETARQHSNPAVLDKFVTELLFYALCREECSPEAQREIRPFQNWYLEIIYARITNE